jgi:hypothetical protein
MSTLNAPQSGSAVWTGTEMIMWNGNTSLQYPNAGGRYNPTADEWTPMSITNQPQPRGSGAAV